MEITEEKIESLKELINIGVGKSADILNSMLQSHIILNIPNVEVLNVQETFSHVDSNEEFSAVELGFNGDFSGKTELIFSKECSKALVQALVGSIPDPAEFAKYESATVSEIGNIVINAVMGAISNFLGFYFEYTVPVYLEGDFKKIFSSTFADETLLLLKAETCFEIETFKINGSIALFLEMDSFETISAAIENICK